MVKPRSNTRQLLYASDILYITVEFSSRLAVGLMFKRLSASSKQIVLSWMIIGGCIVFGIASVVAFAVNSNAFHGMDIADPSGVVA